MKLEFALPIAGALLLAAAPARADMKIPYYEDVQYPAERTEFEGIACLDSEPIVTPEATFDAPHVTIFTRQSTLAEATSEDPAFWDESPKAEEAREAVAAVEPARMTVAMCK
jgi:hypothetical protein